MIFLRGAAPGDRVEAEITEVRRRFARARVLRMTPGDRRAPLFCGYARTCGGCPWMPVPIDDQRAALDAHVRRALGRVGPPDAPGPRFDPLVPGEPDRGWRSTARLHWRGGALGYHAAGGQTVVDVEACPVLAPPLPDLLAATRAALGPHLKGQGTIRLSGAPDAASGTLEVRPVGSAPRGLKAALAALVDGDGPCHGAVLVEGRRRAVFGRPHDDFDGVRHPAEAFVQAHRPGNRALTDAVVQAALGSGAAGPVLELYAGSGNFTFALAERGLAVTAVEIDRAAARALNEAARRRGLADRVRALAADAGRLPRAALEPRPTVALLDPPRAGARDAVDRLAALGPGLRRIVYVSCNPATLARDVARCVARGWRLESARPFDLFPHTGHVEVLAVLVRAG